jgi:hypothetical protein
MRERIGRTMERGSIDSHGELSFISNSFIHSSSSKLEADKKYSCNL